MTIVFGAGKYYFRKFNGVRRGISKNVYLEWYSKLLKRVCSIGMKTTLENYKKQNTRQDENLIWSQR